MNARLLVLCVLLPLLLSGCSDDDKPAPALSDQALANASYPFEMRTGEPVQLKDGKFSQPNPVGSGTTSVTLLDARARGFIDGDKSEDAAVILAASGGGSGTFISLVVMYNRDGVPQAGPWTPLGDRVIVHSLEVVGRKMVLRMRVHGPNDGLCCPSVETTRTFEVKGNDVALVSKTDSLP